MKKSISLQYRFNNIASSPFGGVTPFKTYADAYQPN
jgi:hypothetical protein